MAMRCMREEVFGPILPIAAAVADDALTMMQDTKYGLTGSVWTKDAAVSERFLKSMTVCVCYNNWSNDVHMQIPWAGVGLSDGPAFELRDASSAL